VDAAGLGAGLLALVVLARRRRSGR
jgi:hypothetical protein